MTMTARERFLACMAYKPVDRTPFWSWGGWPETVERWKKEGYDPAKGISEEGLMDPRVWIGHWFFPNPGFERKVIMSMRYQTFAQAHLFESWHNNCHHFADLDPVPVGDFLYGDLCKTMGYANIRGDAPESIWRLEVHERLGALPSLTVGRPEDVLKPNRAVWRVLERAKA
jgi:hypothetical protein